MVQNIVIPDLTPEDWRIFSDKYLEYMEHMVKNPAIGKFWCTVLEESAEGDPIMHQRLDIPFVKERSLIVKYYKFKEGNDGGHTFFLSGKECGELEKKYAK